MKPHLGLTDRERNSTAPRTWLLLQIPTASRWLRSRPDCCIKNLLIHLGLGGSCAQVPPAPALVVTLVLDRHLAKMTKDILHLGITTAASLPAEVVEPDDLVHEVVDNSNDNLTMQVRFSRSILNSIVELELTVTPME